MINNFTALAVVAMFIEAFITYGNTIAKEHRIQWQIVIAFVVALILCYNSDINLFQFMGISEKYPIVGIVCTGLVMCRGSNYFFEFYKQLSSWRANNPTKPEDVKDDFLFASKEKVEEAMAQENELQKPKDEIEQEDVKVANR